MKRPKKFVFVLMPFNDTFNDVYTFGIKQSCKELNTYCERVDEQIFHERILDRIYNQISKADIIIADMTNRNANVFYEVGYAHGLGKNVILLTQKADDIPFDLKHFPHIVYDGKIKTLSEQLKTRLEWFLSSELSEDEKQFDFGLEFLINGQKIEEGKSIEVTEDLKNTWETHFELRVDIYNSSQRIYKARFKLGIETPVEYKKLIHILEFMKPSPDKGLFLSKEISNIYPNAYKSVDFSLQQLTSETGQPKEIEMKLKIFTSLELREVNFKLIVPTTRESPY